MKQVLSEASDQRPFDICIVGFKCFDLLTNAEVPKYLGGIERMLVALGRGFAEAGLRVAFITFDDSDGEIVETDGLAIFPAFVPEAGVRGLRVLHPRLTSLYRAMSKTGAPVFVQMGAGIETLMTAVCARIKPGAKMIYCLASDSDSLPDVPLVESPVESRLYKLGLRMSDLVVAQTVAQQEMLKVHYGLSSRVIPMPHFPVRPPGDPRDRDLEKPVEVIWIGRVVEGKRLEMYVELARLMPDLLFHVIGSANTDSDYSREVLALATETPNVRIQGRVSEDQLYELYSTARVLCCTSEIEGFPATFIEAWSFGLPVATTFDPDGVVAEQGVGKVASDAASLCQAINELIEDEARYQLLGEHCQAYYRDQYTVSAVIPRFREYFLQ